MSEMNATSFDPSVHLDLRSNLPGLSSNIHDIPEQRQQQTITSQTDYTELGALNPHRVLGRPGYIDLHGNDPGVHGSGAPSLITHYQNSLQLMDSLCVVRNVNNSNNLHTQETGRPGPNTDNSNHGYRSQDHSATQLGDCTTPAPSSHYPHTRPVSPPHAQYTGGGHLVDMCDGGGLVSDPEPGPGLPQLGRNYSTQTGAANLSAGASSRDVPSSRRDVPSSRRDVPSSRPDVARALSSGPDSSQESMLAMAGTRHDLTGSDSMLAMAGDRHDTTGSDSSLSSLNLNCPANDLNRHTVRRPQQGSSPRVANHNIQHENIRVERGSSGVNVKSGGVQIHINPGGTVQIDTAGAMNNKLLFNIPAGYPLNLGGPSPRPQERKKVQLQVPRRPLSSADMDIIATNLGSCWKQLGRQLGFGSGELDAIEYDFRSSGLREVIFQLLYQWQSKLGQGATLKVIAQALCAIKKADIVRLFQN